jgi:nitroreductase
LVIRDEATLRALHGSSLPQTRSLETAMAAIAIVLSADPDRLVEDTYDEGRAAERMLIAANMLGLGAAIAWIKSASLPVVRPILGLPEDRLVRTIVALGHPTEAAQAPKSAPGQARIPREESVIDERWPG